jgi:glycosyltransferase involved in cell wall biosynthesis
MPRVLIVRGHVVTPWELGMWTQLPKEFEVSFLLTGSNRYELPSPRLRPVRVQALRDYLPGGRVGEVGTHLVGDRYLRADAAFASADIVHAEELSFWFAAEAARYRQRYNFKLVQTVWETLPLLDTFRNQRARRARREVLEQTDLFLPATRRAADALALEGVPSDRIRICEPGIDVDRFSPSANAHLADPPRGGGHVILSPGRLVWEKGHHDVLRAQAALKRGLVGPPPEGDLRLLIVGSGPERKRLAAYASELGLEREVEFRAVPYDEMPEVFATASAMVLASLPAGGITYHPLGLPRVFWEEQFGLVLAEAMAAGLDIIAARSGAIPEVLEGTDRQLVAPGDWMSIARSLLRGPLSRPPGERVQYPPTIVERYSTRAAAARLADAYRTLLTADS